jgi:hypothetical protein
LEDSIPAVQFYHPAQNSAIKFYVLTLSGQHHLISNKKNAAAFHAAAFSIQEILINKKSAAE